MFHITGWTLAQVFLVALSVGWFAPALTPASPRAAQLVRLGTAAMGLNVLAACVSAVWWNELLPSLSPWLTGAALGSLGGACWLLLDEVKS